MLVCTTFIQKYYLAQNSTFIPPPHSRGVQVSKRQYVVCLTSRITYLFIRNTLFRFSLFQSGRFIIHDFTWFVIRVKRRVPVVEKELHIFPEHLTSSSFFIALCVAGSLVFRVIFCLSVLDSCPFSFGHCIVCPTSISASGYPFGIF